MVTLKLAQYILTIVLCGFILFFIGRCMWEIWPEMTAVVGLLIGGGLTFEGYKYFKKRGLV